MFKMRLNTNDEQLLQELWYPKRLHHSYDHLSRQRRITLPGLYAIDKWGRCPLLFLGAIGMAISQFLVAMLGTTTLSQTDTGVTIVESVAAQKASIAFICIFIFFFASTWGPIAWVVTGEIFPLKVRAKCLSMTAASNCKHTNHPFLDCKD